MGLLRIDHDAICQIVSSQPYNYASSVVKYFKWQSYTGDVFDWYFFLFLRSHCESHNSVAVLPLQHL